MSQPSRFAKYEVLRRIGQGGMGTAYLARDEELDRLVVIKALRDATDDEDLRQRFFREARTAARLRHPNIVTVFDVGVQDGQPFIAMEYVEGSSLSEIIRVHRPLPLIQKLSYLEQICSGLHHAHSAGVVHRDIKPSNLMVDRRDVVRILDFGIARVASDEGMTRDGAMIGTPSHMSPEQLLGRPVDHRSDIFSVGLVAYELLAYQRAFPGTIADGLIHKLANENPAPLLELCPGLPPRLDAIVGRALAKRPDDRFADLGEALEALREVSRSLDPSAMVQPRPALESGRADPATVVQPATRIGVEPEQAPPADATLYIGAPQGPEPAGAAAMPEVQVTVTQCGDSRLVGKTLRIVSSRFEIGRASGDLQLPDHDCSRQHSAIEYTSAGFVLRDLGSANGTYLNGRRVREAEPLFLNSRIRVGHTILSFSHAHDTSLPDLTGCEVGGRYTLEALIRDSAKGAVYVARDGRLPRKVAVKLLSPDLARSFPGYRELFHREAGMAAQLHHPHICPVLDFGETEVSRPDNRLLRLPYLCLALMNGGSLATHLEDGQAMDLPVVVDWLTRLSSALGYAHRQGVIHGNLKPSAIVFDDAGNPYVTDFSIAQRVGAGAAQAVIGTPAYMAPEQWEGDAWTPATDQFALAVIAYYLVSGVQPFEGQDNPEIRRRNFARGPIPAHEEAARKGGTAISPRLSDVLLRGLAVAPDDRFPSIDEFARAFRDGVSHPARTGGVPSVFLSYKRDEASGWALLISRELKEKYGISVFVDTERRDGAGRFPLKLARAIESCDVFVCLLGSATLGSKWVLEEIRLAHERRKPMIPVFQEGYLAPDSPAAGGGIEALLLSEGVHLLDRKNIHVDHTLDDIARLVRDTIETV